jgi:hypothetical protein
MHSALLHCRYAETNAMEKMHAPTDDGADEPKRPWLNQPIPQVCMYGRSSLWQVAVRWLVPNTSTG